MPQRYENHVRYYPPHHFVFYPLATFLLVFAVRKAIVNSTDRWEWIILATLIAGLIWVSFMMRQHYALTCQNRIVRLELRFRYFALTGQRLEPFEEKLSFGQIAALRFASDAELPALLARALEEKLSADQIKRSIKNWIADDMRV